MARSSAVLREALAANGELRAVINLGNPVLAQGDASTPRGVSVDVARSLADELGVPVQLTCVTAARDSVAALESGAVSLGFVAIDPAREGTLAFTQPYVTIEGVFVVPSDSPLTSPTDVDAEGVRVGVKLGSAYDLHLSRALERASIVRGDEGVDVYVDQGLEAGAGIRGPVADFVRRHTGHRLVEPAFMQIRQALAVRSDHSPAVVAAPDEVVGRLIESGQIARMLEGSGQDVGLVSRQP